MVGRGHKLGFDLSDSFPERRYTKQRGYDLDQMVCSTRCVCSTDHKRWRNRHGHRQHRGYIIVVTIVVVIITVVATHLSCQPLTLWSLNVITILLSSSQLPFPLSSSSSSSSFIFIQNHPSMPINIHHHPPISPCPQSNICALGERVCIQQTGPVQEDST